MSESGDIRVDNIMPELCDVWPLVPFESCLKPAASSYAKLKQKEMARTGSIPVVDQGEEFVSGYTDNHDHKYPGTLPVIVFGDHTRRFKFIDFEFAVGADGTKLLHPIDDLEPRFFFHYLRTLNLESQGYSRHYRFLKEALVPLPPLAEQRRIVGKLELLLGKVSSSQQRLSRVPGLLKRFRQSVLAAACSGKLTADWREENPSAVAGIPAESGKRHLPPIADDERLFEAPSTWQWCRLGTLAAFINGDRGKNYPNKNEYVPEGLAFINTGHIRPDGSLSSESMHFLTRAKFDSLGSGKIKRGDLVYCLRGALGKTAFVEPYEEGAIASSLVIIRLNAFADRKFAYFVLTSPYGKELVARFDNGSAQPNLSADSVKNYTFPLPPLSEQQEIVHRVEKLFAFADQIEARLKQAQAHVDRLTQSLLAKAFRGELVPTEHALATAAGRDYEPADELLVRIRATQASASPAKAKRGKTSKK